MILAKKQPSLLPAARGTDTGGGEVGGWVTSIATWPLSFMAPRQGSVLQDQARPGPSHSMGISLPSPVPACIRVTRMPTHRGLPSPSAAPSLREMGLAPVFLLRTREPRLCFGLLEVLKICRET